MFEYVIKHKVPEHGQGLREDSARAFFQQLMIALEFCHELGIANRWAMVLIASWSRHGQQAGKRRLERLCRQCDDCMHCVVKDNMEGSPHGRAVQWCVASLVPCG